MINTAAGIGEACLEVIRLQVRHFVENLSRVQPIRKKVENIADTNTHAAHLRSAPALHGVDGDTVEQSDHYEQLSENAERINVDPGKLMVKKLGSPR